MHLRGAFLLGGWAGLGLVVKGRLNKQIAHTLGISEKTVKVHRGRVMQKLEVHSLAELIHASGFVTDTG